VLASYAISANFFTDIKIRTFFDDYCEHYDIGRFNLTKYIFGASKITREKMTEFAYDSHFHEACRNSGISGLEFIKNIHDQSERASFLQSRNTFSLSYYNERELHQHFQIVQEELIRKDSLLIAAFNQGRHIAVFGFDIHKGWFTVETRLNNNGGIQFIPSIQEYCTVGDGLMTFKTNQIGRRPDA